MRDRLEDFGDATDVVLITFTEPERLVGYSNEHDLGYRVLIDAERESYRAFGLGRGSIARVYGWRVMRRYIDILRRDGFSRLTRPTEDTLQLGGDFVVDANGILVYGFWGRGPDDRPAVDELIGAVRRAGA